MRIAIDARFYGPNGKGLGRYVQKLIEHLEKLPHDHAFTVFLRQENWGAYQPRDARFTKQLANYRWYSVAEQVHMPRLLARGRFDLVHFPHYNVPLLYRKPFVVTIHDLIVSRYPTIRASTLHPVFYRIKHAAYERVIRSAIRRAKHILTVSEYSKTVIADTYRVPADRITVTYEAAEPLAGTIKTELTKRFQRFQPYLLYVGNAYPHKNLDGLLRAFVMVRAKRPDLKLVLVGKMDAFYSQIRSQAQSLGLGGAAVFPGYVTDDELAAMYANALLYVFPSFEEGFGLPPLEAMQAGVPVACSNLSCLPEVLGDAAAYFDPHQPDDIARTALRLVSDSNERTTLVQRGRQRAARYRWDDLAKTTLNVYTHQ
ncbi:MAG: glycosyltransferase family 4 protein [Candidatus Kerfeldbacteria bacterium]|nr:glycosyltransferase family 4 protein [Candidatus Kerfeldbacteria bacterium]